MKTRSTRFGNVQPPSRATVLRGYLFQNDVTANQAFRRDFAGGIGAVIEEQCRDLLTGKILFQRHQLAAIAQGVTGQQAYF